ncbi:FecR family protein [Spirosoma validum]|uniref:FecR domain-containing protein n=1 Tax=Spirosoma validum TaxID=2771355 RepID=A0A927GDH0_9BACT|nr:FecR domain-containing protein [Spirosoma validum]MBD2753551.1 FecR domain-containing protein [Spirosoma validum]
MESDIHKDLIFSHFSRKTSPLQREFIARWLKEKANEEQYYEWLEEWETKHTQYVAQLDMASQRYSHFLTQHPNEESQPEASPLLPDRTYWWRSGWVVAASVLFLFGLLVLLRSDLVRYKTYETAFGETRSVKLTDGSKVLLNANSTLRIPRWGFGSTSREVLLRGEANFSVAHTPNNQQFIVKTEKKFDVVVVGTEFTVFSRKRGTRVALHKGEVRLHYQEGITEKQLTMKPGQLATLDPKNGIALKETRRVLEQAKPAWSQKRFVFDEVSLQEVAYMLEETYGLQVEIKDRELAGRILAGSFRADNVDQILQSISAILDINVIHRGNRVLLQSH